MCGRFALTTDQRVIASRFGAERSPGMPERSLPRDNIKPSQDVLTIALDRDGRRRIVPMRWGLVPPWSEDGTPGKIATINARAEGLAGSKLYGPPFAKGHRCLIPFDAFYEWSGPKGARRPNTIATTDNRIMAMAGLWSAWRPQGGEAKEIALLSCSIVTVPANEKVAELHDRMPAILSDEAWPAWLGEATAAEAELLALLRPYPAERVTVTTGAPF
jgi:putative SOS response-associated peptidase YedK